MKAKERENEIIKVIRTLSDFKIIVVGGYAVSARARHRFSVDCDIVLSKKDLNKIASVLTRRDYKKSTTKKDFDTEYGGEFIRYTKKINNLPVSVDLLVNALVSRSTDASWSYEYILKNSTKVIVAGIEDSTECLIPNKELLLAFKIHSGRLTDVRDIIMLTDADWNAVKDYINRGNINLLKKQLEIMINGLDNKNLVDSLKGVFELKENVISNIQTTKRRLAALIAAIT